MDVRIPSGSLQYVTMPIRTAADPTSLLVSMAVMPRGVEPEVGNFKTASWAPGLPYRCQILIGPGSTVGELDEGTYRLWVKVTAIPEIPVLASTNYLVIT